MTLRHILCATDFSPSATAAVDEALALASRHGAALTIVHAVATDHPFNAASTARGAAVRELTRRAHDAGVRAHVALQQGNPAGVIVLHASARDVDLIVLGARRLQGVTRARLGSVAEAVIRSAQRPALVVPERAGGAPESARPRSLLCAVDLSAGSAHVVEWAVGAAASLVAPSVVTIVHVLSGTAGAQASRHTWRPANHEHYQYLQLDAWKRLQGVVPSAARTSGMARTRVLTGPVSERIVETARETEASWIVMGMTSRPALARRVFGSTTARVIRTAPCPVLVLPPSTEILTPETERRAA